MFFVSYTIGVNKQRTLGGYSLLSSAQRAVRAHIKLRGESWKPEFIEEDGRWVAEGPDQQYSIRGVELSTNPKR